MLADCDKLLHSYHAFEDGPIFNGYMPCNVAGIGDDDVIAHKNVVCQMTVGHE